jgi:uncharacterized protein
MPKLNDSALIAIALVLASFVFGSYFYSARASKDTLGVVGYASVERESDIIKWSFVLQKNVGLGGVKDGYKAIGEDLKFVTQTLTNKFGLTAKDILVSPVNVQDVYEENKISGYAITQNIQAISKGTKIDELGDYSLNPSDFLDKNIISDISKLKRELLAKATEDAKQRAKAIAQSSKNRVGKLESLKAGIFQITEPLSTEVSDGGIYNTGTRLKSISVTVNAIFYLH